MIHKINCLQTIHYHVNMPNRKLTRCIIDSSLQDLIYPSSICFLVHDDMNSTSRKKSPTITTSRHLHKKSKLISDKPNSLALHVHVPQMPMVHWKEHPDAITDPSAPKNSNMRQ